MSQTVSKFLLVGTLGFILDSLLFAILYNITEHLLPSRLLAFWGAASFIWLAHRYFTFQAKRQSPLQQWLKHMLSCHLTGVLNIGIFWFATHWLPVSLSFVLGIAVGTVSNYLLSSTLVFSTK